MVKKVVKKLLKAALTASAPLFSKKSTMSPETARENLTACSPRPEGVAAAKNMLTGPSCDLQIVIPAYNVEAYLASCMDSVLAQETNFDFRVVLIDDGSTDRTPEIADIYASDPRVQVIHQENRGFSGARNVGLQEIFGKYVMFVDSDDMLCPGAVEALLSAAFARDCDVAEGGAWYLAGEETSLMYRYDYIRDVNALETFHGQPWAKVYKAQLFAHLHFPEGFWYEDSILSFLVWPVVRKACVVPEMIYVHRRNPGGITATSQGRPKSVDTYWITEQLMAEREELGMAVDQAFFDQLLDQIMLNQFRVKFLEEEIQESMFVLTCDLMEKAVPAQLLQGSGKMLAKALRTRDFGAYKMCCKLY